MLSCEHGGNDVPPAYAGLFRGCEALLASHRGWDPGALQLAESLAETLGASLHAATVTRLLVELNRSPGHPQLFSERTRSLPAPEKHDILETYYRPYRREVEEHLHDLLSEGGRVLHLSVHSFTPVFEGKVRSVDLGLLYDPRRSIEKSVCLRWQRILQELEPALKVRRNHPYRGTADGFVTLLRRKLSPARFIGVELEVNQKFAQGDDMQQIEEVLTESLSRLLRDLESK